MNIIVLEALCFVNDEASSSYNMLRVKRVISGYSANSIASY